MNEVLAVDANAAIDFIRPDRPTPPQLRAANRRILPLPVVGELFGGAQSSIYIQRNLTKIEELISAWTVLVPDLDTARIYGRLRGEGATISAARRNDLWIAALCLQHDLPLLTNDRGFDAIPNLAVVHW